MSQTIENKPVEPMNGEIKLRNLLFYVMKKWRLVLIATLIVIACVLGFSTVELLLTLSDDEFVDIVAKEYNDQVLDYTDRIQTLEREIEALEDDLVWQQAYNQDSQLMKIDAYYKMVSTMTYYIDADEVVYPNFLEQYISSTDSLMKRYMLYLNGGELYTELLEHFPEMVDIRYIREFVSVTSYDTTGMITITVIGNDDEIAQTIFNIVRSGMAEVYTEATETIGEHKLIELDSTTYTFQDSSLADLQKNNQNTVYSLNIQLEEKNTELEKLNEQLSSLSVAPLWRRTTIQFIKNAMYTAIGSIVILVLLLAICYVTSDRIFDPDKLRGTVGFDVVGAIPRTANKRRRLLDKAAAAVGNVTLKASQRDTALSLTAQSICLSVLAKGITQGTIALAGSIAAEELKATADMFNQAATDDKLRFTVAGNPMRDVTAVEGIKESGMVVLVEKQNQSLCTDVLKETERIAAWGKTVLGVVLLDADAI